jgi:excisionase family DNA binding protein
MSEEVRPNQIYTTKEAQNLLKISNSTIKRMLKAGLLRANKIGKQYRIMGHEILRLVSPELEQKTVDVYQKVKSKTRDKVNNW